MPLRLFSRVRVSLSDLPLVPIYLLSPFFPPGSSPSLALQRPLSPLSVLWGALSSAAEWGADRWDTGFPHAGPHWVCSRPSVYWTERFLEDTTLTITVPSRLTYLTLTPSPQGGGHQGEEGWPGACGRVTPISP